VKTLCGVNFIIICESNSHLGELEPPTSQTGIVDTCGGPFLLGCDSDILRHAVVHNKCTTRVVFVGIYKFLIIYMLICKRYLGCLLSSNKMVPMNSVPENWSGGWWFRYSHVQTSFSQIINLTPHTVLISYLYLLSVTSPLCSIMNKYIDIIISQNTTEFMYICTIYFTTTCFGPFLGHLQVVP